MEEFIQKILKIDAKTKELTESSESELEKLKQETLEYLNTFEVKGHEESKRKAQESYEKVYGKAQEKVRIIQEENHDRLKLVDDFYSKNKERLVDEAFKLLNLGKEV